ncbi:hypothetical protein ACH5RR_008183 [Cinchona calisaya]|uniref:RNase H type-1 domain-containing protein n=1 Tax=Cinchona calisaya TaxID=153742 RepID=A0ABD3AAT6_9GENT
MDFTGRENILGGSSEGIVVCAIFGGFFKLHTKLVVVEGFASAEGVRFLGFLSLGDLSDEGGCMGVVITFQQVSLKHKNRETNIYADALAKRSGGNADSFVVLNSCVVPFLLNDLKGITTPRMFVRD